MNVMTLKMTRHGMKVDIGCRDKYTEIDEK
jgi:hypothetical protein